NALGCERTSRDAAVAAVVADATIGEHTHSMGVGVVNGGRVHPCNCGVVSEGVIIPISSYVADAGISVAIIHAAIESDVRAPVAAMPQVTPVVEAPVTGRPERAGVGREHPGAGNPVVSGIGIVPIARCPDVVGVGSFGLVIIGQRRRRGGSVGYRFAGFGRVVAVTLVFRWRRRSGLLLGSSAGCVCRRRKIGLLRRILALIRSLSSDGILSLRLVRAVLVVSVTAGACCDQTNR